MGEPKLRFKADDGSEFPAWEKKTLGDLGVFVRGLTYDKTQTVETNGVAVMRSNNISSDGTLDYENGVQLVSKEPSEEQLLRKNDIVICMANGSDRLVGKAAKYDGGYKEPSRITVGAFCGIFRSSAPALPWWFQSDEYQRFLYLGKQGGNGALANLKGKDIENISVMFPADIDEQRKISDFLSAVDAVIAAQQAEVDAWEQRKKGVMQKLFSQEVRFKADDGSDFPDWEEKTFWDVFSNLTNNTLSRECLNSKSGQARNIHYGDVLVKYGAVVDVQRDGVPFVNPDVECKRWDCLKNGDIVIADTAEDETVGKAVEISNIGSDIVYSGLHTIACRPKEEFALGYLGNYINSMSYHDQLRPYMQGIKVTSVSKTNIGLTHLLVPTLPEQRKISDCLTSMDEVIQKAKDELAKWQELKKGLLQQMFV